MLIINFVLYYMDNYCGLALLVNLIATYYLNYINPRYNKVN